MSPVCIHQRSRMPQFLTTRVCRSAEVRLPRSEPFAYTPGGRMEDEMRQLPTVEPSWTSAIAGCLVFTAALLLTVIVASGSIANSNVIVALLAVSIPALVAWLYI